MNLLAFYNIKLSAGKIISVKIKEVNLINPNIFSLI